MQNKNKANPFSSSYVRKKRKKGQNTLNLSYLICLLLSLTLIWIYSSIVLKFIPSIKENITISAKESLVNENHLQTEHKFDSATTKRKIEIDVEKIARKWNLTSKNAPTLLQQQVDKEFDYNESSDFIYFNHIPKTGGTSISKLLSDIFGEKVVPGSSKSGYTRLNILEALLPKNTTNTTNNNYAVYYSHSALYSNKNDKIYNFFRTNVVAKHKKIRLMTIIREPVHFRASQYAMLLCGINRLLDSHNKERLKLGLKPQCGYKKVNLSALVDEKTVLFEKFCESQKQSRDKLSFKQKIRCKALANDIDVFQTCRSVKNLLQQENWQAQFISFQSALGGYSNNPKETSIEEIEEYTLQTMGGVSAAKEEKDVVFFGITERWNETICLLHYMLQLPVALNQSGHTDRVMECRPISWWTEEDIALVRQDSWKDYALWRATNALLDVRVAKMKLEIQSKIDSGISLQSLDYVAPGCF